MKIYFKPERKVYEFWKRERYLTPDKDYLIECGRIVFAKQFKGELKFEYDYQA